jgi:hypothetical protein
MEYRIPNFIETFQRMKKKTYVKFNLYLEAKLLTKEAKQNPNEGSSPEFSAGVWVVFLTDRQTDKYGEACRNRSGSW